MKLKEIVEITGELELLTGLHIGAGNDNIEIGGMDNPVVRDPLTNEPYIPGSSIKGKMRMLLELYLGLIHDKGKVLDYETVAEVKDEELKENGINLLKLFGISASEVTKREREIKELGLSITRLSFYDLKLTEESKKELQEKVGTHMTEEKAEVGINRITGTAEKGALRHTERVPAGAKFKFRLIVKLFEGDDEEKMLEMVKKALKLLELDSLGGSGSRGYGKVQFVLPLKLKYHLANKEEFWESLG